MMQEHRGGAFPRSAARTRFLPWAPFAGLLLLGAVWGPSAAATWTPDPLSWTNGTVLCDFSASGPMVDVSAFGLNGTGLSVGVSGISEIAPNGSVVASAAIAGAVWQVANESTDDYYELAYTASVNVVAGLAGSPALGLADLGIDFVLPAYEDSGEGPINVVNAELTIANWSWQSTHDSLRATFSVGPTYPGSEHLAAPESGWLFASVSNSTGRPLEWMAPGTNATAWSSSGRSSSVNATSALAVHSSSSGTVVVNFGTSAGPFQTLAYTSAIGIVVPATVAGIPTVDFAIVGGAAIVVSLAIAGVARRARRGPSRLIYADEENP